MLLGEIGQLLVDGHIDQATYEHLRELYERGLLSVRPARTAPVVPSFQPAAATAAAMGVPVIPRPVSQRTQTSRPSSPAAPKPPPAPRRPVAAPVLQWAARRQADLILYLGAFLLSISALTFIHYQGPVISGATKSAILGAYTVLFLVLGISLRRWERVREAGPVFVALAAVLTPLTLAAYSNVLKDGDVPAAWIWLAGSSATAALYFLLAFRGYGRLYAIPGAIGVLVAWGSLAASLELPGEWWGAWSPPPRGCRELRRRPGGRNAADADRSRERACRPGRVAHGGVHHGRGVVR